MARPDLVDRRPGWSGVMRLEPLPPQLAEQLLDGRIGGRELEPAVRERVIISAGGNPLFVEEMAAMLRESDGGEVVVPPTIQALLAARLDQLEAAERTVLEHGAVEGEIFHRGSVQALTPQEPRLTTRLTALVRRELVRPDKALLLGDDAFRFRHLLVRDAAYEAMPKARRAELHELFAAWLEERGGGIVELDELLGHHLEQAYRYREELGLADDHGRELAVRAGARLRAAGSRAVERQDYSAALGLLERAAHVLPDERRDPRFEVELGWARFNTGLVAEVLSGLAEAASRAAATGNRIAELQLLLERANYETVLEPKAGAAQRLRRLAEEALPLFEAAGDDSALTLAYSSVLIAAEVDGHSRAAMFAAAERVAEMARRAGYRLFVDWGESQAAVALYYGSTPVEECLRWLEERPGVERLSTWRALLLAMVGRFDEANRLLAVAGERLAELGALRSQAFHELFRSEVARLEGAPERAAEAAREACETLEAVGDRGNLMWFCCNLVQALHELGRGDEAEHWLSRGAEAASDEMLPRILWPQTQAKVLARRGDHEEAELLARQAVALAAETDMLSAHGDALLDLAEVLTVRGGDARAELQQALDLYERKGNLVMVERVRSRLAEAL